MKRVAALSRLAAVLSHSQQLDPLMEEALAVVTDVIGTDMALVLLFDPHSGDLRVRAARGVAREYIAGIDHLKPSEGLAGQVYVSGEPLVVRDAARDPRVTRSVVAKFNVHALACVPLIAVGKVIGVLVTASYDPERAIADDLELLECIGLQLGMAIENARLLAESTYASKLWESTFNAIQDGISVHRPDLQIIKANQALSRILDQPLDTLVGSSCCLAILGRQGSLPDCADHRATVSRCPTTEIVERPGGKVLRVTVSPLLDDQQQVIGSVHVVSDITEHVMLERRIARAEQLALIGELAAGLAHEVKNPLAGIKGALEIVLENLPEGDANRAVLKHVLDETMRVNRVISDLLDYARPHTASNTRTNLNQLIEHAITMTQMQVADGHVEIEFRQDPHLPTVMVDPDEMQKVILNLLLNAVHAVQGKSKGRIIVTTSFDPKDEAIILQVTDNGEGIAPEHLEKIFRPFYTTKKKGTGLGLATSHRIITNYGGTISVESTVGQGSSFVVRLPASLKSRTLTPHIFQPPH
ncbi:MAG: ATP-binding protein [Acidobacteriota bacterium]|nr:ATP-binding protein [Blastocatellia bacterium]MDW8238607.1 ATP-binding protein [Acidobacteriota bacterium]